MTFSPPKARAFSSHLSNFFYFVVLPLVLSKIHHPPSHRPPPRPSSILQLEPAIEVPTGCRRNLPSLLALELDRASPTGKFSEVV